jgi:1-acyl-sn-glycerol-3-phosphate acyltransferase
VGLAIRRSSHLIVNRDSLPSRAECGQLMLRTLAEGESLLVYPEGTAKSATVMARLRNGAFRAAARSGRPIVPIAISGTQQILPRAFALLRRGEIHITVLPPVYPSDAQRLRHEATRAITAVLQTD